MSFVLSFLQNILFHKQKSVAKELEKNLVLQINLQTVNKIHSVLDQACFAENDHYIICLYFG